MKKITMEELQSMLKSDEKLDSRLRDYVGEEKDPVTAQKKIKEFLKQEGYEIEVKKEELSVDDLENVSGGGIKFHHSRCNGCGRLIPYLFIPPFHCSICGSWSMSEED